MQDFRKQAEFDIADRIRLFVQATPLLAAAIEAQRDYIMGETLTVELISGATTEGIAGQAEFDDESVRFSVIKAS